jgi:hypothetical protein
LPLVDLLVDTKTELLELALRSGLKVFTAMLEEDRTALCGLRYAHEPDRLASRAGTTPSELDSGWLRLNCHEAGRKPSFAEGTQSSSNEVMVNLSCSNWFKISTCVGFVLCFPWRS